MKKRFYLSYSLILIKLMLTILIPFVSNLDIKFFGTVSLWGLLVLGQEQINMVWRLLLLITVLLLWLCIIFSLFFSLIKQKTNFIVFAAFVALSLIDLLFATLFSHTYIIIATTISLFIAIVVSLPCVCYWYINR